MDSKIRYLFLKYINEQCTPEELLAVLNILKRGDHQSEWETAISEDLEYILKHNKSSDLTDSEVEELYTGIARRTTPDNFPQTRIPRKTIKLWSEISVAAAIALLAGSLLFFYVQKQNKEQTAIDFAKRDIVAGGNKAFLTLADGRKISLTDAANGKIAHVAGISITKTADGQLKYSVTDAVATGDLGTNTISTPNGGKWQVNLPDGTSVWLNSASSLTYPASFSAWKERRVVLKGEAYFEVRKDKKHPFIVSTESQEIEVLGTHFNVNSYSDEPSAKTTLLEGSVKVVSRNGSIVEIKPGEQSVLQSGTFTVTMANEAEALAWKNDKIIFNDETLESIMRRVSRWYNVDVEFKDDVSRLKFIGEVSGEKKISSILQFFKETGNVDYNIIGRKVILTRIIK